MQGKETRPVPKDPKAVTAEELKAIDDWEDKALRAAGEIYLSCSDNHKTHIGDISDDPVEVWAKLEAVHHPKKPSMRFNAWEKFFSIHMEGSEFLSSLMTRIDAAMIKVRNLRPDAFSLDDLDKELVAMTMIRAMPDSYSSFASSLQLLDKLNKDTLQSAFVNEEALRNRSSTSRSAALSASTHSAAVICAFCGL